MLIPESHLRIWLYSEPTDMRKSYDGLAGLVRTKLLEDPTSGQLFAFINRRRTQIKVLYFDRTGYCIWSKRLERGTFHSGDRGRPEAKSRLTWTDLKLVLEGIDVNSVRRYRRFRKTSATGDMLESAHERTSERHQLPHC